jgi:hypothetical protein
MVEISAARPPAAVWTRARIFYFGLGLGCTVAVLGVRLVLASRVGFCGWRDACFYYTLSRQLADHHGFLLPFVWNYQVGDIGLPNHALQYWRPGASFILALPALFGRSVTLFSAAAENTLATVLLSSAAAWLAWRTMGDRLATLLAYLFCLTVSPLWTLPLTPDSALFYAVAVAWFLVLVTVERRNLAVELLGVALIGVAYFIRNDAILLGGSLAGVIAVRLVEARNGDFRGELRRAAALGVAFVLALLPTHLLLYVVNGHFLNSAIDRVIFLRRAADFRHYGNAIDFATWSAAGFGALIKVRLEAAITTFRSIFDMCGQFPTLLALLGAAIVATRRRRDYGGQFLGPALFFAALVGSYLLVLPVIADHAVPRSATALLPWVAVLAVIAVREVTRSAREVAAVAGVAALLGVVHGVGVARGELSQFHALRGRYLTEARLIESMSGKARPIVAMVKDPAPFTATTGIPSVPLPSNGLVAARRAIAREAVTDVIVPEWRGGRALAAALDARRVAGVPGTTLIVIAVPAGQPAGT